MRRAVVAARMRRRPTRAGGAGRRRGGRRRRRGRGRGLKWARGEGGADVVRDKWLAGGRGS
eukprot:7379375-Prymnesium_polylepis.1